MRGDAGAHHAGADHGDFVDRGHHQMRSSTVAMPWPPPMHCVASAYLPALALQQRSRLAGDARAGGAQRMAERDRAAVEIDLVQVEAEIARCRPATGWRTPR